MKRTVVIFLIFCAIAACFSGCERNSDHRDFVLEDLFFGNRDDATYHSKLILGKWYFSDQEDNTYDIDHYIIFYDDGTAEQCYRGKTDRMIYCRWKIEDGNLITMDDDYNEHGKAKIVELTQSRLVLEERESDGRISGTTKLVRGNR